MGSRALKARCRVADLCCMLCTYVLGMMYMGRNIRLSSFLFSLHYIFSFIRAHFWFLTFFCTGMATGDGRSASGLKKHPSPSLQRARLILLYYYFFIYLFRFRFLIFIDASNTDFDSLSNYLTFYFVRFTNTYFFLLSNFYVPKKLGISLFYIWWNFTVIDILFLSFSQLK